MAVIAKTVWWGALATTLMALFAVVYSEVRWLAEPHNPLRHEYGLGVAGALLYGAPACLVLVVLAFLPPALLPRTMKVPGLALVGVFASAIAVYYSLPS
jgi:hypothetical protein